MQHDARDRIFGVSLNWTSNQARRLEAMIASHRQIEPISIRIPSTLDLSHSPPINVCRIPVLFIAGHDTALAPNALGHIKVETVLLPRLWTALRNPPRARERLDLIKNLARGNCRSPAQHEPDVIISCPFDQW
jgi:hypothetical protein